jgi:cardiolipin synthase
MRTKLSFRFLKNLPAREKRVTLSTLFTLLRVFFAPIIIYAMVADYWGVAFFLFLAAALSDTVDGTLARLRDEQTFLGACLDPLADKILLLSIFFTLAFVDTPLFAIPLWFVLLVLAKEVLQIGGAVLLLAIRGHIEVRPTLLGKITMVVQVAFIIWLFACYFFRWVPIKTYYTMLGVLLFMIIASLLQYARNALRSS